MAAGRPPRRTTPASPGVAGLFDEAAPFATGGVYVNFLTEDESDRVSKAYGGNYRRMVQIKAKYDPNNLFRLNHNVKPA